MNHLLKTWLENIDGQAWLRFFAAISSLGLAFALALASAAASESGYLGLTVVCASLALFLAGFVAVTTVPYLARRVASTRLRDAFNYDVTREGLVYLGITLIIAIAALNTGNNLLFIILAAMLAAIVVSGLASAAVLRYLKLDADIPEEAFAERPFTARVKLLNPRRWLPAFSIQVLARDDKEKRSAKWEWRKSQFIFSRKRQWMRLPDYVLRRKIPTAGPPRIMQRPIYFAYVPANSRADAEVELIFQRRGIYAQDSFSLATRFPFSFLLKSRKVEMERHLLVYPALLEADDFLELLPMITGEFASFVQGRGTDLHLIREHTPQDPARFVDWKSTAKTGALKVREFTREDERRLRIVFDNPAPGAVSMPAYEHAVSMAASLACHFSSQNVELSFAASGYAGGGQLEDFLAYLALVQPAVGESVLDSLPVSPDYNVILTSRKAGSIPSAMWAGSYVIFM
ncbi:MAG TPA: DUF58 domain-containing protein [Alphaproteobacteria bacterium]|nr:DUF58 domain-containing protein [Alphaproteobacteria bacterium]